MTMLSGCVLHTSLTLCLARMVDQSAWHCNFSIALVRATSRVAQLGYLAFVTGGAVVRGGGGGRAAGWHGAKARLA